MPIFPFLSNFAPTYLPDLSSNIAIFYPAPSLSELMKVFSGWSLEAKQHVLEGKATYGFLRRMYLGHLIVYSYWNIFYILRLHTS